MSAPRNLIDRLLLPALEFIYPSVCGVCDLRAGVRGIPVCDTCWCKVVAQGEIHATDIYDEAIGGSAPVATTPVYSLGAYTSPLAEMIQLFKYNGHTRLGEALTSLLMRHYSERIRACGIDLLIPAPLHVSAMRKRGFNQAEIIADKISEALGVPSDPSSAMRLRKTGDQTRLSDMARRANVEDAFAVDESLASKRVAIVDDVVTTGATVRALTTALREAQANVVAIIALAGVLNFVSSNEAATPDSNAA